MQARTLQLVWLVPALALVLLAPAADPADNTVLEVIALKNRTAESLLPVLQPLAGPGATITGLDTRLIVRATPAALAEIRRVVAALDTPLRSLWITVDQGLRLSEATDSARVASGARSGGTTVVVGSRPQDGTVTVERRTSRTVVAGGFDQRQTSEAAGQVQRLRMLEGSPAFIRLGRSVPVPEAVVVPAPGGVAVLPGSTYREAGNGFQVVPRLAGDVVTLEILTEGERIDARGVVEGTRARTTVSGRLGEWIELGGALREAESRSRGILDASHQRVSEDRSIRAMVEEVR